MKISACVITYNHEAYLRQCLDSIVSQVLSPEYEFEIVIGEDLSKDGTLEICREYAAKFPGLINLLPSNRNMGMWENWKRTMSQCRGKYIAVCEGDDFWTDPYKLKKQIDFLDNHVEYAGYAHQVKLIRNNKDVGVFRDNVGRDLSLKHCLGGRMFHTASLVFRSEVVKLQNDAPPVVSADRLLNICIAITGRIYYSSEVMGAYRLHGEGMSTNTSLKQMSLDLKSVSYLKQVYPAFPRYTYLSYVYAAIGLCKDGSFALRAYYMSLSVLFSFAYFPRNVIHIAKFLFRR